MILKATCSNYIYFYTLCIGGNNKENGFAKFYDKISIDFYHKLF